MSPVNIQIATNNAAGKDNVSFINATIEEFSYEQPGKYSLIIANMVLQDTANLKSCINAFAKLCNNKASLVVTMTHPWFWQTYWGYEKEPWFNYSEEIAI